MSVEQGTCYQTDYKRFQENTKAVCEGSYDANAKLYDSGVWANFRSVYVRVQEISSGNVYTINIPKDATLGQYCTFLDNDQIYRLGHVDASEFWLFWSGILILIWTFLAWRQYEKGKCDVPLWYLLVLLAVGLYVLFRSFGPAVSGERTFSNYI